MTRRRSAVRGLGQHDSEPAHRPEAPEGLWEQDLYGNQHLQELLGRQGAASPESIFQIGREARQIALPHRGALEEAFGESLGDLEVHEGPEAALALDALNAEAATSEGTLLLPPSPGLGLTAEEVAHAQQQGLGPSEATGLDSGRGDPAEIDAKSAASSVVDGEKAAVYQRPRAAVHRQQTGGPTSPTSQQKVASKTLLYIQQGTGLLVIRQPAEPTPEAIEAAFADAGATQCTDWHEVQQNDPTWPLFEALLQARLGAPVSWDALAPVAATIVGSGGQGPGAANTLAAGVAGPWNPPGNQPIPFYIGISAHIAIAQAYRSAHAGELVFTNFTPVSSIVESMMDMGIAATPDGLSGSLGQLRPDILNASMSSLYEIKPQGSEAAATAEAAIYVAAFAEAGVVITLGAAGDRGTSGVLPAPGGFFVYSSPLPGVITYRYQKQPVVPVPKPVPEPVEEPKFEPLEWKYWEEVTGLTGAALLIYLIISEGSRLFPARNLVPVL